MINPLVLKNQDQAYKLITKRIDRDNKIENLIDDIFLEKREEIKSQR